ncbi:hypothetical protein ACFL54_00575 [Planctomycetota bacterium]
MKFIGPCVDLFSYICDFARFKSPAKSGLSEQEKARRRVDSFYRNFKKINSSPE